MAGQVGISGFLRDRTNQVYSLAIALPLRLGTGQLSSNRVLAGLIPAKEIAAIATSPYQRTKSMHLAIVNDDMSPISPQQGEPQQPLTTQAARQLRLGISGVAIYRNAEGLVVYGSYSWYSKLNLGIILEISKREADRPLTSTLTAIAVFAVIIAILLLIVSWLLSKRIINPINRLSEAALELAQGRAVAHVDVQTGTEIDNFASCFDYMAILIQEREALLKETAARDSLTGLYNHGRIGELLELEIHRQRRERGSIAVIMLDIDLFKRVNDSFGHQAGDAVLVEVARLIAQNLREGDVVGRYGGEEFAAIIGGEDRATVEALCERIRQKVELAELSYDGQAIRVTVSIGYAYASSDMAQAELLVGAADAALYAAKDGGRNMTCSHIVTEK